MSDHDVQYSTEFPSGYGDLELKLSDNVIFSFPRGILAHVSPVFKDMFSIGDTNDQREPLALTEASNTIKEFLLYIDPLKYSRGFTLDTVESLLEAATKYKVAAMVEIFEKWAVRGPSYIYIYHDTSGPSERDDSYPIKSNPMLFLSLAERFDFSEIGGISIRDAVLADKTCISISKYPLGCTTTIQLMELRIERIKILTEKLGRSIRAEMDKIQPRWGSSLPSQSRQTHHPPPSAFCGQTNLTKNASGCLECLRKLCDLVVDLPMRLHDQPSWSAFMSLGKEKTDFKCSVCKSNIWRVMTEKYIICEPEELLIEETPFGFLETEICKIESEIIPLKALTPNV